MLHLLLVGPALASGLDVPAIGSQWSGTVTADPAALHWNPARLASVDKTTVSLGGGMVLGRIGYQRNRLGDYQLADAFQFQDPVDEDYLDPSRSGESDAVSAVPISPVGDAFVAIPVGPVGIGFGVYVPYAAPLKFPDDGAQRYALQEVFIAVSHVAGGIGWDLDTVQLGAQASLALGLGELSRVQDFAGLDTFGEALSSPPISQDNAFGVDAPSTVRELDVLSRPFSFTDANSIGVDAVFGIATDAIEDWTLGLAYQVGTKLKLKGDFALNLDDPFFTEDLVAQGLQYDPLVTGEGELSFKLPGRLRLAVARSLGEDKQIELHLGWIQWSQLEAFELSLTSPQLAQPTLGIPATLGAVLPRDWVDSVHVEVATRWGPATVTVGYHSPASPNATVDVASPDGHRLIGAGGGRVALGERLDLLVEGEVQTILPRTVTDSAYDLGNGRYSLVLGTVGAHLNWELN